MIEAFATADQVLLAGVQGITDLITTPGLINLDFADVKWVMQGAGSALMGIGSSRGADRAIKAAELAVESPLLEASIEGAHGVLLSIQGGSNLGIFEINDAAQLVKEAAHPEANIIFGAVIDDTLGDEVRVTVIAAGFDGGEPPLRARPGHGVASGRRLRSSRRRPQSTAAAEAEFARTEPVVGRRRRPRRAATTRRSGRRRSRHPRLPEVARQARDRRSRACRSSPSALAARLADVDARIADAARAAGRDPATITRIVVTKFHPASARARALRPRGARRRREPAAGVQRQGGRASGDLDGLRWHFIGQAQTNKARADPRCGIRRPLDRPHGASPTRSTPRRATTTPCSTCCCRSTSPTTPARGGVAPDALESLAEHTAACRTLRAARRHGRRAARREPPRPRSHGCAGCSERVRAVVPERDWISAGMTADFAEAIAAGATHLRIGSAITGPRPLRG